MNLIVRRNLVLWFLVILLGGAGAGWGQSLVKVHKPFVAISTPDEDGNISISGAPGAIETTSAARLTVQNLTADEVQAVELGPDGSFKAILAAVTGDKIRITATNQERKRSYGTFEVAGAAPVGREPVGQIITEDDERENSANLAVLVMIVDLDKGEIVSTRRIAGVIGADSGTSFSMGLLVRNVMSKCLLAIKDELQRAKVAVIEPLEEPAAPADEEAAGTDDQ